MTTTEAILKERDTSGVYFRRVVTAENGAIVSDERVKKDPVLVFTQPALAHLDDATLTAVVTISLELQDFDGEGRTDSGVLQLRIRDRVALDDEGVAFTRPLVDGHAELTIEFDTPGEFVVTVEPPLVSDLQLAEPIRVKVT